MLLKYNVSNFRAIGHTIEYSMFPLADNIDDRFLTNIKTKAGDWHILRRGAIFGPNASGKSTFIKSLKFARDYVLNPRKSGSGTGITQFEGDFADLDYKSTFQFVFFINGEVYQYGFSLDRKQVNEEWLMILTKNGFATMFERVTDEVGKSDISIGAKLARKNSKNRAIIDLLKSTMQINQKNQLFLYKLHDNGVDKVENIINWFKKIQFIFPNTKIQGLPIQVQKNKDLRLFIANALARLDTGVINISVLTKKMTLQELLDDIDVPKQIVEDIEDIKNGIVNINGRYFIFSEGEKEKLFIQIKFEHKLNNKIVKFNVEDESDGTQRLIDLLPILFKLDKNNNRIYFVDELDRSLHTKLSKYFLQKFIDNKDSLDQIVFTAHDVNLINLNLFKQEEIWFIEKNNLGECKIRPFSDFDIKHNQDIIKSYLNGRFGAIPVIRNIRSDENE